MACGAAAGGVARWGVGVLYNARLHRRAAVEAAAGAKPRTAAQACVQVSVCRVPWHIAGVNVAGSLVLGAVLGWSPSVPPRTKLLVGTGFCGALTTMSTFATDVVELVAASRYASAAAYVAVNNVGSIGAAALGYAIARRWSRAASTATKLRGVGGAAATATLPTAAAEQGQEGGNGTQDGCAVAPEAHRSGLRASDVARGTLEPCSSASASATAEVAGTGTTRSRQPCGLR